MTETMTPVGSISPRNKPCPCGSGTKYKRCCWLLPRQQRKLTIPEAAAALYLNRRAKHERAKANQARTG